MSLSSAVVSTGVSEAVGSSKMAMRCGTASARAICASWRWAIESRSTGTVTGASTPKARIASAARRFISRSSTDEPAPDLPAEKHVLRDRQVRARA